MTVPNDRADAWIDLSPSLTVLGLSEGARQLYGLEEQSVVGRPLTEVILCDSGRIDWRRRWDAAVAGARDEQLMLHRSCTGLRVWVHARLEARPERGQLYVRPASGHDVVAAQPGGMTHVLGRVLAVGGVGLWMDDRLNDEFEWSEHTRVLHDVPLDAELSPALLFGQIHPEDRSRAAADIQRAMAERIPYDGVLRVKSGEHGYRHLHVFGAGVHDAEGLQLLGLGGVRDVSEELALKERVHALENQLRAAQRGDVVGRLAGGIAHDFNNILTGILGCCEMLADSALSERQRADVQQIRSATLRAADLTRQLLAFGRRQALRRRAVAPATVLEDVIGLLRRTVPENIEISLSSSRCEGRVLVDVTQLHQVLTNLVVNAAQAMTDGGRIAIGASEVTSSEGQTGDRAGEYVCFVVEDSGPGVPSELRARIFEPFFSTKPPGQGSGLGLSVVQGIVEQHLGHIRVGSGALGGARFEVYLPVTREAPEAAKEAPPTQDAGTPARGLRVLLVEDEKMVRELTKRILGGAGFSVLEAADAESALALAAEHPFDVLLSDVVLPTSSGPQIAARLRERGLDFHVIYMSGYPADFVDSRVQLGQREVLVQKPFTAATLLDALRHRARC